MQVRVKSRNVAKGKIDPRHREISIRYAHEKKKKRKPSIVSLRCAELRRLFVDQYGHLISDDDAGRDDAMVMLHHLAAKPDNPERAMSAWLSLWCPWLPSEESSRMIEDALANPRRYRADYLAKRLGLTAETRARLKIRTIGAINMTKADREQARKTQQAEDKRAKRRANGVMPRHEYLARSQERVEPWKAEGISRPTWFRRRRAGETSLTNSKLTLYIEDRPVSPTRAVADEGRVAPAFGQNVSLTGHALVIPHLRMHLSYFEGKKGRGGETSTTTTTMDAGR